MDIVEIKKKLEGNLTSIKELFYVSEIGIFGSFVKGSQRNGSDIDILVTFVKGHKDCPNEDAEGFMLE